MGGDWQEGKRKENSMGKKKGGGTKGDRFLERNR